RCAAQFFRAVGAGGVAAIHVEAAARHIYAATVVGLVAVDAEPAGVDVGEEQPQPAAIAGAVAVLVGAVADDADRPVPGAFQLDRREQVGGQAAAVAHRAVATDFGQARSSARRWWSVEFAAVEEQAAAVEGAVEIDRRIHPFDAHTAVAMNAAAVLRGVVATVQRRDAADAAAAFQP